ncbi:DUF58 domain-containing protein [Citricoccus muralis]|uniref:Uncharacterized protein (DUF58 family) n=1 Tax=Citricoccus muralis TaxID=169134 RepID=A0A3D9LC87_9MICC|nr:DUF58 domain-containing protein [Citricoccus muralis]REE03480.1 uncharacterized protein (DUF58 family) [Citricoccus muralis]
MVFSGRFLVVALVCLLPVVLRPGLDTIGWCLLALALVSGVDLALAASPRSLVLERELPASSRLDEPVANAVLVSNRGRRRLRGSLRDAWQPSAGQSSPSDRPDAAVALDVPAGERRRTVTTLMPRRRGTLRTASVTVRSWGPLGLAARQVTHPVPGQISILPPFRSRRHLPSRLARLREMDGRSAVQTRGGGTEFDSLRDYVRGDDVRSIDWRATARRRDVVVRTWRPERDRRVVIVLDTSRTAAARVDDEPKLDTGIEASLLLAALASAGGDRVELLAFDRRVRSRVSSTEKGNLLHRMVTALAPVQPTLLAADWSHIPVEVAKVSRQRSLVVLLTDLDSASLQEGLLPVLAALTSRHQVVVASVADPQLAEMARTRNDAETTFRAAAAERAGLERRAAARELEMHGVEVVDEAPYRLPPALADTYLRLKAAGRL